MVLGGFVLLVAAFAVIAGLRRGWRVFGFMPSQQGGGGGGGGRKASNGHIIAG